MSSGAVQTMQVLKRTTQREQSDLSADTVVSYANDSCLTDVVLDVARHCLIDSALRTVKGTCLRPQRLLS